jgi:uncharacterized protein (TIGR03000 family)
MGADPAPGDARAPAVPGDGGLLTVRVPADAKVFVNGLETKSTGPERNYISRGLKAGSTYKYEVRAVVERGGKQLEDVRVVYLTAGSSEDLAFDLRQAPKHQLVGL